MIDRQHGNLVFECDGCEEVCETGTDEFSYAVSYIKREGWLIRKVGEEWTHECPRCVPKSAMRTAKQMFERENDA